MPIREILTRRNLPHWFVPHAWHFVTYRLVGTIPESVLHQFREARDRRWRQAQEAGRGSASFREQLHKQFFADYDRYLDRTCKIDWLARPPVAATVRGNLYHHRGSKYDLLAYCVMPNHVHVLLRPTVASTQAGLLAATEEASPGDEGPDGKGPLAGIMHSLKSYTANEANKLLDRTGQLWQHESYDHWVRDEEELERIVLYIAWNPVKAQLVAKPHEWYFSSAHDRYLADGAEEGYLLLPESS
jgi:putative DNA methylase